MGLHPSIPSPSLSWFFYYPHKAILSWPLWDSQPVARRGLALQVRGRGPLSGTSGPARAPYLFGLLLPSLLLREEL